ALVHNDLYNDQTPFMFEVMTPNAYHKDNFQSAHDFAIGTHTGTTLGMNHVTGRGSYRGIGRANMVIERAAAVDMDESLKSRLVALVCMGVANMVRERSFAVDMDEALKSRLVGEAKFLRAFFYQKLNVLFSGVPLILSSPDATEHSATPRSSYDAVKAQILADLDDAIASLPASYNAADDGRATKGAALALKAQVHLQDHEYPAVVETIDQLNALGVYALFADYNGLFRKANEGNAEIIFDVRFQSPQVRNSYDIIHAQYNTQAPVQGLVDAYQMIDGKPTDESPLYNPSRPYE